MRTISGHWGAKYVRGYGRARKRETVRKVSKYFRGNIRFRLSMQTSKSKDKMF